MMSTSFAYKDPILRASREQGMNTAQKTRVLFKEMGQGMWRQGKSFGRIGGMYAMVECIIEGVCRGCLPVSDDANVRSTAPKATW